MAKQKSPLQAVQKDLQAAWKLLNQLAATLSRVTEEMSALSEMNSAGPVQNSLSQVARTNSAKAKARASGKRSIRSKKHDELPDTTGDFFAKHISRRKRTAPQIFELVLQSIDTDMTGEQKNVLRNRLAVWLSNAVKSKIRRVDSIGTGKDRRYFHP